MDFKKYQVFEATGQSLQAIKDWQAQVARNNEAADVLAEEVGARAPVKKSAVVGFVFKVGAVPDQWKRAGTVKNNGEFKDCVGYNDKYGQDKVSFFAPQRRRKAHREIWRRMDACKSARGLSFEVFLGGDNLGVMTHETFDGHGFAIRHMGFEKLGDIYVINVPIDRDGNAAPPPDGKPMKASDYWLLKEAQTT